MQLHGTWEHEKVFSLSKGLKAMFEGRKFLPGDGGAETTGVVAFWLYLLSDCSKREVNPIPSTNIVPVIRVKPKIWPHTAISRRKNWVKGTIVTWWTQKGCSGLRELGRSMAVSKSQFDTKPVIIQATVFLVALSLTRWSTAVRVDGSMRERLT